MGIRNRLTNWLVGQRPELNDAPTLDALDDDVIILDPPGTEYPKTVGTTHPMTERTGRELLSAIQAIPGGGGGGGGDASAANQVTEIAKLTSILAQLDVALSTRASQTTIAAILAKLIAAPSTEAKQDAEATLLGSVTETAPATDTASSGQNGRLQRLAQRLTTLIGLLPVSLGQKSMAASLAVTLASDQSTLPVSAATLPLPSGAATESTLATRAAAATQTDGTQRSKITDGTNNAAVKAASTAPLATDPALVVSLSPNSPALTIASEVEVKNDTGNPIPVSAASLPLPTGAATEASLGTDITTPSPAMPAGGTGIRGWLSAIWTKLNATLATTQSGTWTVQPGNTANTTAWKVDGSAVTQPVSAVSLPLPTGASTSAKQPSLGTAGSPSSDVISVQGVASGTPQPVSAASLPLPAGAATEATLDARTGSLTETAPASDTASSGINGRLQRIAQRITSFIALFPASIGQKAKAASLAVALPTDQVGPAGTAATDVLSVQGIAGMTAVKVDGSAVTQPVSATSLPLPSGASTEASLSAQSLVDNAAFSDGTSRVLPSGHIFDESAGTALTENDVGASRMDSKRAQVAVIEDATTRGTRAKVLAASTAAVATDPALVVAVSPNNTIPISAASLPLPTGAASETTVALTSAVAGTTSGAAVITDANGTLQQYLRGIVKLLITILPASLGQKVKASSLAVTIASDQDTLPVSLASVPSHAVTNAGTFAVQATLAAGASSIGKAEDTASVDGDVGVPCMALQKSTPTDLAGTDGDYAMLQMKNGLLFIDGSKVTQPISASALPLPTGAATSALQSTVQRANNADSIAGDKAISVQGCGGEPIGVAGVKLSNAAYSPTLFKDRGAISGNSTAEVKAGSGNVFSAGCINTNPSKVNHYLQLHNKATAVVTNDVPVFSFLVPSGAQILIGTDWFTNEGTNFASGIQFAYSTTLDVYTAAPSAYHSTWIQYK